MRGIGVRYSCRTFDSEGCIPTDRLCDELHSSRYTVSNNITVVADVGVEVDVISIIIGDLDFEAVCFEYIGVLYGDKFISGSKLKYSRPGVHKRKTKSG